MKKICKLITLVIFLIPIIINARVNYDEAVSYANNHIYNYPDYNDYINLNNDLKYDVVNNKPALNSRFKKGGFITQDEYAITNVEGRTYLANGLEYWTMTQSGYNSHYTLDYALMPTENDKVSGTRITQFIKKEVSVNGNGTYSNPWVFAKITNIHLTSDNRVRGGLSNTGCSNPKESITVNVTAGTEQEFYICPANGFRYYKSSCSKYISSAGGNKYTVSNVDKDDLICNLSYTYKTIKVNLEQCDTNRGCTSKTTPETVYVNNVHGLWFNDPNGLNQITKVTPPVITGYTFAGYELATNNSLAINADGTFSSSFDKSKITSQTTLKLKKTANKYKVTLNASKATSTNHTKEVTATYDSQLPVITKPSRSYTITFDANGGNVTKTSMTSTHTFAGYKYSATGAKYYKTSALEVWDVANNVTLTDTWTGGQIELPTPTRVGYDFSGWYEGTTKIGNAGSLYTPEKNMTLKAKWTARTDTKYTVNHWKQNLGAPSDKNSTNYTKSTTDNLTGTTDTKVTPNTKSFSGFEAPTKQEVNINADGSRVVDYYYTRKSYTLTLEKTTGIASVSGAGTYQYEQEVTVKTTLATGYKFVSWSGTPSSTNQTFIFKMPASKTTLKAQAQGRDDTKYTVNHWIQNIDGADAENSTNYTKKETDQLTGTTDKSVTPATKNYTGFTSPSGKSITIKGDGTSSLNYYYKRKSYELKLTSGTGIASVSGAGTYKYEKEVSINATVKDGYHWTKWDDGTTSKSRTIKMGAANKTLKAIATGNDYSIVYDCNGGSGSTPGSNHVYGTGSPLSENKCKKTDYVFDKWNTKADGSGQSYSDKESVTGVTTTANAVVKLYVQWKLADMENPTCKINVSSSGLTLETHDDIQVASYDITKSQTASYNKNSTATLSSGTFYGYVKDAVGKTGKCSVTISETYASKFNKTTQTCSRTFKNYNKTSKKCITKITGYNQTIKTCTKTTKYTKKVKTCKEIYTCRKSATSSTTYSGTCFCYNNYGYGVAAQTTSKSCTSATCASTCSSAGFSGYSGTCTPNTTYSCSSGTVNGAYCYLYNQSSCPSGWSKYQTSYTFSAVTTYNNQSSCTSSNITCNAATLGRSHVSCTPKDAYSWTNQATKQVTSCTDYTITCTGGNAGLTNVSCSEIYGYAWGTASYDTVSSCNGNYISCDSEHYGQTYVGCSANYNYSFGTSTTATSSCSEGSSFTCNSSNYQDSYVSSCTPTEYSCNSGYTKINNSYCYKY